MAAAAAAVLAARAVGWAARLAERVDGLAVAERAEVDWATAEAGWATAVVDSAAVAAVAVATAAAAHRNICDPLARRQTRR